MDSGGLDSEISRKINGELVAADPAPEPKPSAPAATMSWRDILSIHRAANRIPNPTEEEKRNLAADLSCHGQRVPVVLVCVASNPDARPDLLDGRTRLDLLEADGVKVVDSDGQLLVPHKVMQVQDDTEAENLSLSLNVHRRQLSTTAGGCHLYQRGELVVRPIRPKLKAANDRDTFGWKLIEVTRPFLIDALTRIIRFEKFDGRVGDYVPKNCPDQVAEVYLSRAGRWKIPLLLSIVSTPFLRVDGSLCERPGYDPASALLFHPERQSFPTITPAPTLEQARNEEELEKRLGAVLISGDPIISLDNCSHEVDSTFLCQALTQRRLRIRLLGYSRTVEVPITAAFYCNGNNLEISNDLTRRTLLCRIDAGVERPELRTFKHDVLETARNERARLVEAILIILRGWHSAGTAVGVEPLGSFEEWSFRVRSPLLWLDRDDPCDSIKAVRESDPHRSTLNTVLVQWKRVLGTTSSYTIQQVIQNASIDPDLFGALAAVAVSLQGNSLSNERLGRWLSKNNGKIVNRLKLQKTGSTSGYPFWRVIRL
jgi:hypothetical protein